MVPREERDVGGGIARIEEPRGLSRRCASKIIEEQGADLGDLRGDDRPARLQVVEGHVDRLHDVGQGETVADVGIPLEMALEFFHRAQDGGILQYILIAPLDDDHERLDAAKILLDLKMGLVIGRILPYNRGVEAVGSPIVRWRTWVSESRNAMTQKATITLALRGCTIQVAQTS